MSDFIRKRSMIFLFLITVCFFQAKANTNTLSRASTALINSANVIKVSSFGAKGDGVTDDSESINKAIAQSMNKVLDFEDDKVYIVRTKLNFSRWSGEVKGKSWIKCVAGIKYSRVIDLSFSDNVIWNDLSLDMGQTVTTEDNDLRSDNGFYMFNSRNITLNDVEVKNVRIGEPIYINGSSSIKPSKYDGSKYIYVNRFKCIAIPYNKIDKGAMFIIRSDFYTGTGKQREIYGASNGVNKYTYTVDQRRTFPQTTEFVYINDCYMENFDRFALLNVRNIEGINNYLVNFYTRGITLSPTCSDVKFKGGAVGANAAMINVNLGCSNVLFDGIEALGSKEIVGQRHGIRTGQGCRDIMFKNIRGYGCETALVAVEGVQNVTFENVHLKSWLGGVSTNGIIIGANNGVDSGVQFPFKNVKFINCSFYAKFGIYYRKFGHEEVDFDQIIFQNVKLYVKEKYNTTSRSGVVPSKIRNKDLIYNKTIN